MFARSPPLRRIPLQQRNFTSAAWKLHFRGCCIFKESTWLYCGRLRGGRNGTPSTFLRTRLQSSMRSSHVVQVRQSLWRYVATGIFNEWWSDWWTFSDTGLRFLLKAPLLRIFRKILWRYIRTLRAIRGPFLAVYRKYEDEHGQSRGEDRSSRLRNPAVSTVNHFIPIVWIVMLGTAQFFQYRYVAIHFYTDNFSDLTDSVSSAMAYSLLFVSILWANQR